MNWRRALNMNEYKEAKFRIKFGYKPAIHARVFSQSEKGFNAVFAWPSYTKNLGSASRFKKRPIWQLGVVHCFLTDTMVFTSFIPAVEEPQCNIVQFLFENRLKIPENRKILIDVATGASLTLAQLKDLSLRFAAGLQDVCNFKRNDVVLLFAPNQVHNALAV